MSHGPRKLWTSCATASPSTRTIASPSPTATKSFFRTSNSRNITLRIIGTVFSRLSRSNRPVPLPCSTRRLRSEEHTSELQSRLHLVCRLLLEKQKKQPTHQMSINITYLASLLHHTSTAIRTKRIIHEIPIAHPHNSLVTISCH